ncbi:MAG: hypothetical protein Q8K32_35750 [Archangium sp.]|nr:hypothetical protein [Archangium sp.]
MNTRSAAVALSLFTSCVTTQEAARPPPAAEAPRKQPPPVVEGVGTYARPVSHASQEAQRWFNQGLNLVYGFNHDEAIRSFAWAAELAPDCALCAWGVAYANGPHINNPQLSPENAQAAWAALKQAQARAAGATPVEQALITALAARYADPPPADRAGLDAAYAEAMRGVHRAFPTDADVVALTAEALMDLHPWDLYLNDNTAKPWTAEIVEVTRAALALAPRHPMANHLLIHALEGSADPQQAQGAADLLRTLQPGLGHMVHMPSHIDVRTGQWVAAIEANRRAIEADEAYRARAPEQGFYALYMAHNHQMLAFAAMMTGRSQEAIAAMNQMVAQIPPGFRAQAPAFVDAYFALPLEVLMRFGKWEEILATPEFGEDLPASRALRQAARGVAFAATGRLTEARAAQQAFEVARGLVPAEYVMGQNPVSAINEVAGRLLEGEILYAEGKEAAGLAALRGAVEAEDRLKYDEPPDWLQPTRHALGAALNRSRKHAEAEKVFREDLRRTPDNGWALFGLSQALEAQGQREEARATTERFTRIWEKADLSLNTACLCQSGR